MAKQIIMKEKNGTMLKNDFGKLPNGSWVYLNNNGDAVTGEQTIRGKKDVLYV